MALGRIALVSIKGIIREIEKEIAGVMSISLENAVEDKLLELKAYGGTEQPAKTYIDSVTAEGKCVQASTPTPTTPVDIACNNGTIKFSKNMANVNSQTALVGYYINPSGVVTADIYNRIYQEFIPVQPNTTYTLSCSSSVYYVTISEYSTAEDSGFIVRKAGSTGSNTSLTITTEATTNYVRFGANLNRATVTMDKVLAINWQLERGSTATTYKPYVQGGVYIEGTTETITDSSGLTATCENLLSAGNYKDTQEILTGLVTRNIGILVLDGTENRTASTTYIGSCFLQVSQTTVGPYYPLYVTHFVGKTTETRYSAGNALYSGRNLSLWLSSETTAATLKQWLTDQYDAGTPVIVVYPLVTATTENVTGQQLNIAPVTATGSVSDLVATAVTSAHTTPTPVQPLDINCNNGVVKISPNLFNKNSYTEINAYVNSNTGKLTVGSPGESTQYCAVIPCLPNTTYTISGRANSAWGAFTSTTIGTTATSFNKTENGSITTGANDKYLIGLVRANQDVIDYRNTLQVELGSTATPYMSYGQIYTDGTVETVEITGVNLANMVSDNIVVNKIINADGGIISSTNNYYYSPYIPIRPNTSYVMYGREKSDNTISAYNRICWYDKNQQFISRASYTVNTIGMATSPANARYARFTVSCFNSNSAITLEQILSFNWTFAQAAEEIPYEPYFNGGTATAEMLLKVGDYKDEQEILSGNIARKVGIKVLDGTENWTKGASSYTFNYYYGGDTDLDSNAENELVCNQFAVGTRNIPSVGKICVRQSRNGFLITPNDQTLDTTGKFKQWLADQYNAGTPIIIVYPLNTPTTESVTGQTMNIPAGNSTIEITQASLNTLELSAKYKALP